MREDLVSTENRISFARQHYNDCVMDYNTRIATVPSNMLAGMFGFKPVEFFELEDMGQREAPKVSFA
jgi:LemA protein